MNYHKELKDLIWLKDSQSISEDEFIKLKKKLFTEKNKFDGGKKKLLVHFNNGNYFKIEEINIHFSPINPHSKYSKLISKQDKLDFLHSKRLGNIDKNKPINTGLPDSKEESEAIKAMIEEGESRQKIFYFFQRSETVLHKIIKKTLAGELDDEDPYILAAKRILDQT